jgi:hypothetical protein
MHWSLVMALLAVSHALAFALGAWIERMYQRAIRRYAHAPGGTLRTRQLIRQLSDEDADRLLKTIFMDPAVAEIVDRQHAN